MRRAMKPNGFRVLPPAAIAGVALVATLGLASAGEDAATATEETSERLEQVGPAFGEAPEGGFREPDQAPEAERAAVEPGAPSGLPEDVPGSDLMERAGAILANRPPDASEVYALIKVSDRATGERRVFARGVPDPSYGLYLEDPSRAPEGKVYSEMDLAWAERGIEFAIRSVLVQDAGETEPSPSPAEEEEIDLRERNGGGTLSHRIDTDLRSRIESGEIDLSSEAGDRVPVMIEMQDVPELRVPKAADPANGGLLWAGLDVQADRQRRLIERKQAMAKLQAPLVKAVEEAGGRVEYASWMSGTIQAELPPATIERIAATSGVFSIEYLPPAEALGHRYMGDDIHAATNAQDYDPWHPGWHGISSKHSYTSRVVLAMSEECVNWTSPAWRTGGPGSASRGRFYDIDPNSGYTLGGLEYCINNTSHGSTGHAEHRHGHWVLGNMAGDFMDGQEAVLTSWERRQRTGTCEECFFLFGQDWNLNERTRAHDWACDKGADIFQSSIAYGGSCDGNGSFDGSVQALVNCGAVYVQSAGNNGSLGGCSTSYPADHPWTFAVGGMRTQDPCDTAGEYYTGVCQYDSNASRGGATYDGCGGCADVVDLTGPYRVCHGLDPNTANPTQRDCIQGTSFASPVVAGLMGRSMDWYRQHVGTGIFYDNRMRNFMLLMGDRSANFGGTGQWLNTTDPRWGAGRVRLETFDQLGCWNLIRASVTLSRGSSYTWNFPIGDCVQFWKAVVWHNGRDYSNEPKIRLIMNPTGCSTPTAAVDRLDSKTVLRMTLNGCTGMSLTVRNVGVGFSGTRRFHVAAYGKPGFNDRGF